MQTQTFVQASAQVMRVTELAKGNVYKRLETSSYSSEDQLIFGIVLDVLNNGETTVLQVMEFKPTYQALETKLHTFSGGRDLAMFPATPLEIETYLADCVQQCQQAYEQAKTAAEEKRKTLKDVERILDGELVRSLSAPAFTHNSLPEPEPGGSPDVDSF